MIKKQYTIVRTPEQVQELINHINEYSFFGFDTETTGLNVRKDKVIGMSICGKEGKSYYYPLYSWNKVIHGLEMVGDYNTFVKVLRLVAAKEIITWNGSYDIRIVKNNFGIDLTESLVADGMLMKHTVDEEGEFTLKGVTVMLQDKLGIDAETEANEEQLILKENVKANGGTITKGNFEMYKADLEVMGPYACADADYTLRLSNYYRNLLEKEGLEDFFYDKEVMPLYKYVTIPMEERGIRLDIPLMNETRENIQKDIEALEIKIRTTLESYEEVQAWLLNRAIENHPVSNRGSFANLLLDEYNTPLSKLVSGNYSYTKKAIAELPDGSHIKRFLLGDMLVFPQEKYNEISWKLAEAKGENKINISSKQQMAQIVFDCLGYEPLSYTDKKAPQFNEDMIEELRTKHGLDWARDLSNYNKLIKIRGTYIDGYLEEQEDGIFYPSFFQHRTISGRFGSNIQQLPRVKEEGELDEVVLKYVNMVRAFFIARNGRYFVDSDYESLEPHTFAHVSNDEGLRNIFRKGHDFYSTIAIATEKMEGVSADKKAENYLGKVNKQARQKSKSYSLGVPYGMSAYALAMTLGISVEEAEVLIDGYLSGFPELKKWMDDSKHQAQYFGYVKSEVGRIRHLPRVKELHKVHGEKLLDMRYRKSIEKKIGKDVVTNMYRDYKNGLNNARNFQIQSLSASIVNMSAIAINKYFKDKGIDAMVCAQVHDQLIVDVPEAIKEECAKDIQYIMENTYKLSLSLKAPASLSKNFRDGH